MQIIRFCCYFFPSNGDQKAKAAGTPYSSGQIDAYLHGDLTKNIQLTFFSFTRQLEKR